VKRQVDNVENFIKYRGIAAALRLVAVTVCTDQDEIWHGCFLASDNTKLVMMGKEGVAVAIEDPRCSSFRRNRAAAFWRFFIPQGQHFLSHQHMGHGSYMMGHESLSEWVNGSWVTVSDALPALLSGTYNAPLLGVAYCLT